MEGQDPCHPVELPFPGVQPWGALGPFLCIHTPLLGVADLLLFRGSRLLKNCWLEANCRAWARESPAPHKGSELSSLIRGMCQKPHGGQPALGGS